MSALLELVPCCVAECSLCRPESPQALTSQACLCVASMPGCFKARRLQGASVVVRATY
jgi:hypothetical protein